MVNPLSEEYYSTNLIIGLDEKHFYEILYSSSSLAHINLKITWKTW